MEPMTKCKCGSTRFKTTINLEIRNVPVLLKPNGSISYDDTKGDTDGWDTLQQSEITCKKCGSLYDLEKQDKETRDGRPTYRLLSLEVK